jgi:hypothetical protein
VNVDFAARSNIGDRPPFFKGHEPLLDNGYPDPSTVE